MSSKEERRSLRLEQSGPEPEKKEADRRDKEAKCKITRKVAESKTNCM